MPDRSIIPPIKEIENIHLPQPRLHTLDNGIPVYEINMGTQDILKMEVIFNAGRPFEHQQLVARATAALLREGTLKKKAAEIHETVDFYGGTLSIPVNLDTSNVVLYSLTKHFDKLLPLVSEILTEPAFPEKELDIFIKNSKQRLQVDLTKNDVLAYRTVTEKIFGVEHPYGYNSVPETYDNLSRKELKYHFERNFNAANCKIIISGKTNTQTIRLLNEYLGKKIHQGVPAKSAFYPNQPAPQKLKLELPDTVQTAIRIGSRLFNRQHKDYTSFYVLNNILGGYFGSRLMTTIREKKGYTYNIFSSIDPMLFDGYFYIGTEVGNEFVEPTCKAIYQEFEKLRNQPIEEEELRMVKNYLLGFFLNNIDGAFNVAELVKIIQVDQLSPTFFDDLVHRVKTITPTEIMELSNRYLHEEKMWEVIVGV